MKYFNYQSTLTLLMLIASCTPIELFYKDKYNEFTVTTSCKARKNTQAPADTPVRKTWLSSKVLIPTSQRYMLEFEVTNAVDSDRRFLLNVKQGDTRVQKLKAWINGLEVSSYLAHSSLLTAEEPDMVADLCPHVRRGTNYLEFEVQGPPESSAMVSLEGFMLPVNISGAVTVYQKAQTLDHTNTQVLNIKFLEGMKVRLDTERSLEQQLIDLNGMSLYPLRQFIRQFKVMKLQNDSDNPEGTTPEENDKSERKAQEKEYNGEKYYREYPNRNLYYTLYFEQALSLDQIQHLAYVLEGMPFLEWVGFLTESEPYLP